MTRKYGSNLSRFSRDSPDCVWVSNNSVLVSAKFGLRHNMSRAFFLPSHSFIPLACAECDHSLMLSGASSIPVCYIPFPSTLFHQLIFHPPVTSYCHLFLGLPFSLLVSKFIYNTFFGNFIFFQSLYMPKPTKSKSQNYKISDNVYEHSDFPRTGENVYRNRKAINQPLLGTDRRGTGRFADRCL